MYNKIMIKNYDICKALSREVYNNSILKEIDGWLLCEKNTIENMEVKSKGKVIKKLNLAYTIFKKDNQLILAFRGTNDPLDFVTDMHFVARRIPPSMIKATNVYKKIRKKNKSAKIYITGHSLGGAYAQVVAGRAIKSGDTNCYAITFNAPGLGYALKKSEREKYQGLLIKNISNFIVMNDFVGNFREHLGASYYVQPYPLNIPASESSKEMNTPHGCIISCDDNYLEEYISCPQGWNSKLAWSIFVFDETKVKGYMGKFKKTLDLKVNRNHLKKAVDLIKKLQSENKIKLANYFKFKAGRVKLELIKNLS